jgi:hypothetical protein
LVAHTGLEPVISALRGQRVNQLHQCAANDVGIIESAKASPQVTVSLEFKLQFPVFQAQAEA